MTDEDDLIGPLKKQIAALEIDLFLARAEALQGRKFQAAALEREPERVKRAFVEGYNAGYLDHLRADCRAPDIEADRRLAEGTI